MCLTLSKGRKELRNPNSNQLQAIYSLEGNSNQIYPDIRRNWCRPLSRLSV
jgi:hypothetical protein